MASRKPLVLNATNSLPAELPAGDSIDIAQLSGVEPAITAGTTAQYWRGDKSWQALNKSDVGLSNVDNTSDVNKPVSTAQQTALNLKQNSLGITNGSNAAAGQIGEYISASIGATAISSGVFTNLLSISLTAGDWEVSGGCAITGSATNIVNIAGGSSATSATLGPGGSYFQQSGAANQSALVQSVPTFRYNVTTTTTIYLVVYAGFSTGTASAFGLLQARRMR